VSFGLLLAPAGPDVPPAARLEALVDVLLSLWRDALGPAWTVCDGPVWGAVCTSAVGTLRRVTSSRMCNSGAMQR
jgi:hypothetical protein